MDKSLQQNSQIHADNYSLFSVYEQYQYSNAMLQSSMSQNQPGYNITKMEYQQNRPIYTGNSAYLPPSQQANEYVWTHLENTNSILQNQPCYPQNIKMIPEQYLPVNNNAKMYVCEICKRDFTTKHSLDQHRLTHRKEKQHYELNSENVRDVPALTEKQNFAKQLESSSNNIVSQYQLDSCNENKFVCRICSKALYSKQKLTIHVRTHTGEKPFVCSVCEKRFADKSNLTKHFREHTGEKPYVCDVCKEAFSKKAHLHRHKVDAHIGEKPFSCDLCEKKFLTQEYQKRHLKQVHGGEKPYVCNVCSKAFQNRFRLDQHQVVHTEERKFNCEICNLGFKYRHSYMRHLKTNKIVEKDGIKTHIPIKITKKEFVCDLCSKAFTTERSLMWHKRRHMGDKPFVCDVCNLGFVSKGILNAHVKLHSEEQLYVCHRCNKSFLYKCLLDKHNLRHDQPGFKLRRRDKSENVCKLCNLPFLSKKSLNKHLIKVHREKPYSVRCLKKQKEGVSLDFQIKIKRIIESKKYLVQYKNRKKLYLCPVCEKRLTSKQSLVNHTRIHTGEKPFACKVCEKKFTDKSQLNQHLRKHSEKILSMKYRHLVQSNNNIHKCSLCSKTFLSVSSMISHRYTHILKIQCFTENFPEAHSFLYNHIIHTTSEKYCSETYGVTHKSLNCNVCNETFCSIFSLIKHKRLHILRKRFVCNLCKELFISKFSLELHLSHHKNKKSFTCDICQSTFHKQSLLNIHLKAHDDGKVFTCKICEKTFSNELAFQKHEYLHIGRILYVCRKCNKHVSSYYIYNAHLLNHTTEHCQFLDSEHLLKKKSVSDTSIVSKKNSKIKKALNEKKIFVCAMCPKSFDDRNVCIRHMELHSNTHVCWICNKKFNKERYLLNHMHSHVGKPFICGMCPKSFSDKNSCVMHMQLHTEKKPQLAKIPDELISRKKPANKDIQDHTLKSVILNVCKNEYSDVKNLHAPRQSHRKNIVLAKVNTECAKMLQKHLEDTSFLELQHFAVGPLISNPECPPDAVIAEKKMEYKLNGIQTVTNAPIVDQPSNSNNKRKLFICDKQVSGSHSLENPDHSRKQFSCEICKKSYLNERTLKTHEKRHTFACEVCNKVFKSKYDLKVHVSAIHSDFS